MDGSDEVADGGATKKDIKAEAKRNGVAERTLDRARRRPVAPNFGDGDLGVAGPRRIAQKLTSGSAEPPGEA